MPSAPNTNPEITFIESVHQSIRMECRRTSWKHVEPNIITYYCFDEHYKYSTGTRACVWREQLHGRISRQQEAWARQAHLGRRDQLWGSVAWDVQMPLPLDT